MMFNIESCSYAHDRRRRVSHIRSERGENHFGLESETVLNRGVMVWEQVSIITP